MIFVSGINFSWHNDQTFSRDCAIEYTSEMSWGDSYKMLDRIHYGKWYAHSSFGDNWASITARKRLRIHKWKL